MSSRTTSADTLMLSLTLSTCIIHGSAHAHLLSGMRPADLELQRMLRRTITTTGAFPPSTPMQYLWPPLQHMVPAALAGLSWPVLNLILDIFAVHGLQPHALLSVSA